MPFIKNYTATNPKKRNLFVRYCPVNRNYAHAAVSGGLIAVKSVIVFFCRFHNLFHNLISKSKKSMQIRARCPKYFSQPHRRTNRAGWRLFLRPTISARRVQNLIHRSFIYTLLCFEPRKTAFLSCLKQKKPPKQLFS